MPLARDLRQVAPGVEQSYETSSRRENFRGEAQGRGKHLVVAHAALQKLTHLRQQCCPLRAGGEILQHFLVLIIELSASQVFFSHFFLQSRVGLAQFLGALLDLSLQDLLLMPLFLHIQAGTDPSNDRPLRIADRVALYQEPAIASVCSAQPVFNLQRFSNAQGMFPL
jgi:hypothetical protein